MRPPHGSATCTAGSQRLTVTCGRSKPARGGGVLQPDPEAAPMPPISPPEDDEPRIRPEEEGAGTGRRKGVLVRISPEAWKALKLIALDREITLQDLMTEAINDVLAKHSKPPVA